MKNLRVLRGQFSSFNIGGGVNLIQDDHRFNHGFRVKKFVISIQNLHSSSVGSRDMYAVLATHEEALTSSALATVIEWNWDDKRQVAWASTNVIGDSYAEQVFELVDPTHVVVRDLWIGLTAATATSTDVFNYYIELERIDLSDNEAVMAIVQEVAQDVN